MADATYAPGGAGFIGGGTPPPAWDPIGGTDLPDLYRTWRVDLEGFTADVPDGAYVLSLHFCELEKFGPALRVMRIVVEEAVLDTVDVFAIADHAYAVRLRRAVTVEDGQFNLDLESLYRPTILSAIELVSAVFDTIAPATPADPVVRDGYRSAMLTWDLPTDNDAAGILVYRDDGTAQTCITQRPVPTPLLLDYGISTASSYGLRAVDVFGNAGDSTPWAVAEPMAPEESLLPVYEIHVEPEDLAILQDNPWTNTYVPASLTAGGVTYDPVGLRYRGNVARRFTKKSYKIRLEDGAFFEGADVINLNGDYADWSLLHACLGFDLFADMGVRPPAASHAHLEINDRFAGVYYRVEQPDVRLLRRTGRDSTASIYKCNGNLGLLAGTADYERCYDKETNEDLGHDDLITFVEGINLTGRDALPAFLLRTLDVAAYLNYYSVIVATANNDFTERNYYLIHDLVRDVWEILPWDLDLSFGLGFPFEFDVTCSPPIDVGTTGSPQCIGGANMLVDRVLSVPAFRAAYCRRLKHLLENQFAVSSMAGRIDSLHDLIAQDAVRDVLKLGRENPVLFEGSVDDLKSFVAMRRSFLLDQLAWFAPPESLYVYLNEVQPDNGSTLADESGEFDPWVELWNMSPDSTSIAGWSLQSLSASWTIPDTAIGPGRHLLLWLDGETLQGSLHCSWRLDASGGQIVLNRPGGMVVDAAAVPACGADQAYYRSPDGGSTWRTGEATPGTNNPSPTGMPPTVSNVTHTPPHPAAQQPVAVFALVSDPDADLARVDLLVDRGPGYSPMAMFDDGSHGDTAANDSIYGAIIPGFDMGATVHYVVRAEDSGGAITVFPPASSPGGWVVGFDPPEMRLNEFMASNDATIADEWGEFDDWVEIIVGGDDTVGTQGLFLTDDFADPDRWPLPPGLTLAPGRFLLVWADDQPAQGPWHAPFKLDAAGEQLGLYTSIQGIFVPIDTLTFGGQTTDVSCGRFPDANGPWGTTVSPTPGCPNAALGAAPLPGSAVPRHPTIESLWPNPAQTRLGIRIGIPDAGMVGVSLYDLAGRVASRAWSGVLGVGWHTMEVTLDLPAGVYVAVLDAPQGRASRLAVISPRVSFQPFVPLDRPIR
ncbi:MAG: CotH kinase family protein [Candidatus Eisenbacteria bacterium]|nr:CotH kinase family protein [Candidatus Eisenbacteria bacterium]